MCQRCLRRIEPALAKGAKNSRRTEDANGQSLAYIYSRKTKEAADIAKVLTEDEARPIASNIAKLPVLLGQARPDDSLEAESNLSDERHEAEDTTRKHS